MKMAVVSSVACPFPNTKIPTLVFLTHLALMSADRTCYLKDASRQ